MKDKTYKLTPKALAVLALMQVGLITSIEDPRAEGFWAIFEHDMTTSSYVREGGADHE